MLFCIPFFREKSSVIKLGWRGGEEMQEKTRIYFANLRDAPRFLVPWIFMHLALLCNFSKSRSHLFSDSTDNCAILLLALLCNFKQKMRVKACKSENTKAFQGKTIGRARASASKERRWERWRRRDGASCSGRRKRRLFYLQKGHFHPWKAWLWSAEQDWLIFSCILVLQEEAGNNCHFSRPSQRNKAMKCIPIHKTCKE